MIQFKKQFKKRPLVVGGVIVLFVIAAFVIGAALRHTNQNDSQSILKDTGYSTILPANTSITQLGGWRRVSPDGASAVYAYSDTIEGIAISVSEQPIPASFKPDIESHVTELAKSDNATTIVKAGNITLHIGVSAKGPQSVYFTKNDLLILIKSEKQIKNEAWSAYASSLQ